jgi:hypothetical protein
MPSHQERVARNYSGRWWEPKRVTRRDILQRLLRGERLDDILATRPTPNTLATLWSRNGRIVEIGIPNTRSPMGVVVQS